MVIQARVRAAGLEFAPGPLVLGFGIRPTRILSTQSNPRDCISSHPSTLPLPTLALPLLEATKKAKAASPPVPWPAAIDSRNLRLESVHAVLLSVPLCILNYANDIRVVSCRPVRAASCSRIHRWSKFGDRGVKHVRMQNATKLLRAMCMRWLCDWNRYRSVAGSLASCIDHLVHFSRFCFCIL